MVRAERYHLPHPFPGDGKNRDCQQRGRGCLSEEVKTLPATGARGLSLVYQYSQIVAISLRGGSPGIRPVPAPAGARKPSWSLDRHTVGRGHVPHESSHEMESHG